MAQNAPIKECFDMEQMTEALSDCPDSTTSVPTPRKVPDAAKPKVGERDWAQHPLNLRVSLPLPFGRWYVTLIAGKERRGKERLVVEREKHPLETAPNLMFLFSIGVISAAILIVLTVLVLIHGFGWSVHLVLPS